MKKLKFRTIAKLGFLLVVIGFFMPIACNMNGFEIAGRAGNPTSLLMYGLFVSAILGVLIGGALFMNKKVPVMYDWIVLAACILCGLIPYLDNREFNYQTGAYLIVAGWVLALALQLFSRSKKER